LILLDPQHSCNNIKAGRERDVSVEAPAPFLQIIPATWPLFPKRQCVRCLIGVAGQRTDLATCYERRSRESTELLLCLCNKIAVHAATCSLISIICTYRLKKCTIDQVRSIEFCHLQSLHVLSLSLCVHYLAHQAYYLHLQKTTDNPSAVKNTSSHRARGRQDQPYCSRANSANAFPNLCAFLIGV
jgi:hypothetical protein